MDLTVEEFKAGPAKLAGMIGNGGKYSAEEWQEKCGVNPRQWRRGDKNKLMSRENFTIINDGQFIYPVKTKDYLNWIKLNGPITPQNYENFCSSVDFVTGKVTKKKGWTVGSPEMIDYCKKLLENGANYIKFP